MSLSLIFDILLGGLILGGLYALIAVGLGLQYGVARVLNVSHGEFIMLGAFATYSLYTVTGMNPILSLVITGPVIFAIAFALHRTLFRYIRKTSVSDSAFEGNSLLASFGLLFVIQNVALLTWGSDIKGYSYLTETINVAGAIYAVNRVLALILALTLALVFYLFLARTRTGKAIRAAAQNLSVAQLMGIDIDTVLGLCFGLGALMAALAGALVSMMFEITPLMGLPYTVIAIIAVVLGGLGNIMGSLVGGLILGVVGNLVTYLHPGLSMIAFYIIFLLLILLKPKGILGR